MEEWLLKSPMMALFSVARWMRWRIGQQILCRLPRSLDFNEGRGGGGISYKGDNSTCASIFLFLCVGFMSSGIESKIHSQVGLLDGVHVNAVLFQEVLKLCFLLTNSFSIPVCKSEFWVTSRSTLSSPGDRRTRVSQLALGGPLSGWRPGTVVT